MTDAVTDVVLDDATAVDTVKAEDTVKTTTETTTVDTTATDTTADTTKADDVKKDVTSDWPDSWRELMAGEDEDAAKLANRYNSPKNILKALKEAQSVIRSGKIKRDMPDPSDEKAMAEWRKEQGIPDDPSGYKLPDTVTKRLTDDDKPVLASFTEFAHSKGAPPAVVEIASEWYINQLETMEAARVQADTSAAEAAEDALRKDWAHGEFKANLTLAKRFASEIPGVGAAWSEARLPDGRRIGDVPEFVAWAADMGRDKFGDVTFANSDSAERHNSRKAEIEKVMKSDIDRYYTEGMDKEYATILERETKRK
jgi:hypothetical protein